MITPRLTQLTKSAGWAAKIGPDVLAQVLRKLQKTNDARLLVGIDTSDDAAIVLMSEDIALVQTLDFFTPVVDDPYVFGQIAVANSLSDVYAMGGTPLTAMNIVCFPKCLPSEVLEQILLGGSSKIEEAGALLVGGHSIEDDEPKYGLSVTGTIHPKKVLSNNKAKVGDVLILTKPLGLGILNTAVKASLTSDRQYEDAIHTMKTLNKYAIEAIKHLRISACTDITGFGLIGHAYEVAKGSGVSIVIDSSKIPVIEGACEFANMGIIPAGMYSNKEYVESNVEYLYEVEQAIDDVMYDPQTSGGLLVAIDKEDAKEALYILGKIEKNPFELIGEVVRKREASILIK